MIEKQFTETEERIIDDIASLLFLDSVRRLRDRDELPHYRFISRSAYDMALAFLEGRNEFHK